MLNKKTSYFWLIGLIPLSMFIREYIIQQKKDNLQPVLELMQEQSIKENGMFFSERGTIYTLSNTDSIQVMYKAGRISSKTPNGMTYISRDTSVGQVTGVMLKKKLDTSTETTKKLKGIYFEPNSTKIIDKHYFFRSLELYTNDSTNIYFTADTFTKDTTSYHHTLAKNRLLKIKEKLQNHGFDTTKFKLKAHHNINLKDTFTKKMKPIKRGIKIKNDTLD